MSFFQRNKQKDASGNLCYTSSPLLKSPTPIGRSRLLLFLVGVAFAGLLGRAFYVQIYAEDFFQAQGAHAQGTG